MHHIDAASVASALKYPALVDAIERAFQDGVTTPLRQHHEIELPGGTDGAMLVMPAWRAGRYVVVKMVSVFPDNAKRGLASVLGVVVLIDATTGAPLATLDGPEITLRRTAAASALAAKYLAPPTQRAFLSWAPERWVATSPAPTPRSARSQKSTSGTVRRRAPKISPQIYAKKVLPHAPLTTHTMP